jgi:hypothetical protein
VLFGRDRLGRSGLRHFYHLLSKKPQLPFQPTFRLAPL